MTETATDPVTRRARRRIARREAAAKLKANGEAIRAWLDRPRPEPEPEEGHSGGYGVTRVMSQIRVRPPEYVHQHTGTERKPYVNPEKDRRVAGKRRRYEGRPTPWGRGHGRRIPSGPWKGWRNAGYVDETGTAE